jgi:hypothetical protein
LKVTALAFLLGVSHSVCFNVLAATSDIEKRLSGGGNNRVSDRRFSRPDNRSSRPDNLSCDICLASGHNDAPATIKRIANAITDSNGDTMIDIALS